MKQLVVLSGKGGTGKTSLTAAFASLAGKDAVFADCDVDASNLPIVLQPEETKKEEIFEGGEKAVIDPEGCINCGRCMTYCRFDAISPGEFAYQVTDYKCDGCHLCSRICPTQAITMVKNTGSRWYISETRFGPMVHARLGIAEENSGKLVTMVRHQAKLLAEESGKELVLIDGPPGIGCPTTSSLSGTDLAVMVAEASQSGLHDLQRVIDTAEHFRVKPVVIINKFNMSETITARIEDYCRDKGIPVLARLPFDRHFVEAMTARKSIMECGNGSADLRATLQEAWRDVEKVLQD